MKRIRIYGVSTVHDGKKAVKMLAMTKTLFIHRDLDSPDKFRISHKRTGYGVGDFLFYDKNQAYKKARIMEAIANEHGIDLNELTERVRPVPKTVADKIKAHLYCSSDSIKLIHADPVRNGS